MGGKFAERLQKISRGMAIDPKSRAESGFRVRFSVRRDWK